VRVEKTDGGWKVGTVAAGDTRTILCKQIVDCTGNGAVAALLGFERLREEEQQPGSFIYTFTLGTAFSTLDGNEVRARFSEAVKAGTVRKNDCRGDIMSFIRRGGDTWNYVEGADNSTADARTDTNLRGRASMLRMFRFLKTVPGLERIQLTSMSPEVGVRETYRVRGEHLMTHEEYTSGMRWEDSVCHAFYPIDVHHKDSGVTPAYLAEGVVATVPLRALIPKGSVNLLVAGRCLSSDRLANSALRVQATCMATGQAAGAAAALSVRQGKTPGQVPAEDIKALLRQSGAIVP